MPRTVFKITGIEIKNSTCAKSDFGEDLGIRGSCNTMAPENFFLYLLALSLVGLLFTFKRLLFEQNIPRNVDK
jgi:hypothetical protein